MKISKIIISLFVALILIHILSAKIIGGYIEGGVKRTVLAYSQQARYPIDVYKVETGWFSSSAEIRMPIPAAFSDTLVKIGLPISKNSDSNFINFKTDITHGPIIIDQGGIHFNAARASGSISFDFSDLSSSVAGTFGYDISVADEGDLNEKIHDFLRILDTEYFVEVTYRGDVSAVSESQGGVAYFGPPENKQKITDVKLEVTPSSSHWFLAGDNLASTMGFDWQGFNLEIIGNNNQFLTFTASSFTLDSDLRHREEHLWIGDANFSMGPLSIEAQFNDQPFTFDMGEVTLQSSYENIEDKPDFIKAASNMKVDGFEMVFNQGVLKIDQTNFDGAFSNLSTKLLNAEAELSMQGWRNLDSAPVSTGLEFLNQPELAETVHVQLNAVPRFDLVNYSLSNVDGIIGMDGYLQLNPGLDKAVVQDGASIYKNLQGEFNVLFSPNLIKSLALEVSRLSGRAVTIEQISQVVDLQITQYRELGFLVEDGRDYKSNIVIVGDVLTVNGKPLMQVSQAMNTNGAQ